MKKICTVIMALIAAMSVWANGVEIDGINYILAGDSAVVTYKGASLMSDPHYAGTINIPASVTYQSQEYRVTSIGGSAFYGCTSLLAVTLPNTITSIGDCAFYQCTGLTSFTMPENVNEIGANAFWACNSLPSSNYIRYADTYAIKVTDKTRTTYTIKEGTKWLGSNLFQDCKNMTSINIPSSVISIESNAFTDCAKLASIDLPSSLRTIKGSAFYRCHGLTSISLPEGLIAIGGSAFLSCENLATVNIPSTVTSIVVAFSICTKLTDIFVDPRNKHYKDIDGVLYSYNLDTLIEYPIGKPATEYTLSKSVKHIGERAFYMSPNLQTVIISDSIESIGKRAFYGDSKLTTILCKAPTPPSVVLNTSYDNSFYNYTCDTLYVPYSSIDLYKSTAQWKNFKHILPIECCYATPEYLKDSVSVCQGGVYNWRGQQYSTTGTYYDIIPNQMGCDSIIHQLKLTITPTYNYIKDTLNIVEGDSIEINNKFIYPTKTKIWCDSLQTIHGCDSLVNHYVVVTPKYNFTYSVNDTNAGYIISSHAIGNYDSNTKITLQAVANEGYQFMCWDNGSTTNPLSFTHYSYSTYKALFTKIDTRPDPEGLLSGAFSVAEGKCVKFAKGNLQYNAAQGTHVCADSTIQPGTWRFAENQYDVVGSDNLKRSEIYNGWIDLFSYGTSGYNGAVPYTTLPDSALCSQMGYILTTHYDFGEYNAISNGGNEPGLWRLFTISEWQYMINKREHALDLRGQATVCGVMGLLLFPDTHISKLGKTPYTFYPSSTADWTKANNLAAYNVYNEATWKLIEADGAVFLPYEFSLSNACNCPTFEGECTISMIESSAIYMTPHNSTKTYIEGVGFNSESVFAAASTGCSVVGVSVRLISTNFYRPEFEIKATAADTIMGSVDGAGKYEQDSAINLTAKANYGYHFTQWNDGNKDNPRQIVVTKDTSFIAYFEKESYTITTSATNGTIEAESTALYKDTITLMATPNVGYHFAQWQDGNTDNPRKIEIVQDTTMAALFAMNYNGICGDSLYWVYEDGKLQITGKGAMYDFEDGKSPWVLFKDSIMTITLPTDLATIGKYAFAGCVNITEIVMGANIEEIGAYAFASCKKLTNIACFAVNPPKSETSTFATYKATLVVVCESQTAYEDDDVFGSFKTIKCDGATEVTDPITDPTIVPTDTTAVIIWPKDNDAASYQIVIKKDGNVYIILTFNRWGQLIGISLAPSRGANNATMAATDANGGFQFTITSLDPATTYSYDITSKREDSSIINSYDGEFTTTNGTDTPTDLLKVNGKDVKANKILINGQMYIIREGKIFNSIGQEQQL